MGKKKWRGPWPRRVVLGTLARGQSGDYSGWYLTTDIKLCRGHGVEYVFRYGSGDQVRSYYSRRWCRTWV